jgi:hypothetical protein
MNIKCNAAKGVAFLSGGEDDYVSVIFLSEVYILYIKIMEISLMMIFPC